MSYARREKAAFSWFGHAFRYASIGAFLCLPVLGLNPDRLISQYAHSAWRLQDASLGGQPWTIAQTTDGYIWVGTYSGIVRFDGVRFVPWIPPGGEILSTESITALLGTSDGDLWIGTFKAGSVGGHLWRWHHQQLTQYPDVGTISSIYSIREKDRNSVWVATTRPREEQGAVCEVEGERLHCYDASNGLPGRCCVMLAKDSGGDFWIAAFASVVKWKPRSSIAEVTKVPGLDPGNPGGASSVIPLNDGSALFGIDTPGRGRGLQRFSHGAWTPLTAPNWNSSSVAVLNLFLDSQNTLWVATKDRGLYRIRNGKVDHFGSSEGLTSDFVNNIFEDREGNIWVATIKGIDCFRDLAVSMFTPHEGLSAAQIDTVFASRNGAVWAGGDRGLDAIREGGIFPLQTGKDLPGMQVTSLFEDRQGRFWVGLDHSMSIFANGTFKQIRRPDGSELGFVVGIAEDIDGDVWVEISGKPRELIRIRNLQVKEILPAPGMPAARRVAADPKGGIWLGLMSGDLARYRRGTLETFHFAHTTPSYVNDIMVNPDGSVLGATGFGLIGWREGRQQILSARNGLPCDTINAFVRDDAGDLWLYMQCGLVRVAEPEIQKWWANDAAVLQMRIFDSADGVQAGIAPFQGAARGTDGKLWFANEGTLQMIDPLHLPVNSIPPPVHVEEVTADRKSFALGTDLHFPALTRDVAIRYTALSFVAPQKVRFRYMLEGQDKTWQEAGTRREAFYTNLAPRSYRFRVIACNNDGLWNETGDSLSFTIAPAYYQTNAFVFLCTGGFVGGLWLLYLLRLRVSVRANHLFQESIW
jgi:ligand-binding sensor domain-containing protein